MAEQYRAQWNHSDEDVTRRVAAAAADWICGKYGQELPADGEPYTREFIAPGRGADAKGTECFTMLDVTDPVARDDDGGDDDTGGEGDSGGGDGADGSGEGSTGRTVAFRLTETKPDGAFWSTEIIATAHPDGGPADYYCSVSTEQTQSAVPISIAAPRVATALLEKSTSANWPLDPTSMRVDDAIAGVYADALASRDRSIPFIVLRPADESDEEHREVTATADAIARRLAGLCAVQVIGADVEAGLSERFTPGGYFVPAGHVRIFHPSTNGGDLATRTNPMRRLRSSKVLMEWVTMQVAPRSVVRQPPAAIARYLRSDRALRTVGGGAGGDAAETIAALEKANKRLAGTISDLERDNGALFDALSETSLEYGVLDEEFTALDADAARRKALVQSLESALSFALSADPTLERDLRGKGLWPWPDGDEAIDDDVATIVEAMSQDANSTSADCFEHARELLGRWLSIPDDAAQQLEALDASPNASVWAAKAWRAFVALAAYAEAKAADAESKVAGFWEWCDSGAPLHWPATKKTLAMKESEGTMNNRRFAATRTFPTEEGGTQVMEAHIKIAEGGGDNIPRLYFAYDDDLGKVRVGFFGPHRLVPNPSAS